MRADRYLYSRRIYRSYRDTYVIYCRFKVRTTPHPTGPHLEPPTIDADYLEVWNKFKNIFFNFFLWPASPFDVVTLRMPRGKGLREHLAFAYQLYNYLREFRVSVAYSMYLRPYLGCGKYQMHLLAEDCPIFTTHKPFGRTATSEDNECSVCLRQMRLPLIKINNCGHTFHARCLNEWRKRSATCPMCRRPIPIKYQTWTERLIYHHG
jgi:hypothetical protein